MKVHHSLATYHGVGADMNKRCAMWLPTFLERGIHFFGERTEVLAFNNFVLFDRVHLFAGARYRFLAQRFFRASARRALRLFLSVELNVADNRQIALSEQQGTGLDPSGHIISQFCTLYDSRRVVIKYRRDDITAIRANSC
jgi:hypothetical protein